LQKVAVFSKAAADALATYQAASGDRQDSWTANYLEALDKATIVNNAVQVPFGDYGPVPVMMDAMLLLGKSGLLDGALQNNSQTPYVTDMTASLLFFQDDIYAGVADSLDLTSPQWGIVHETGNYPAPGGCGRMPFSITSRRCPLPPTAISRWASL